MLLRLCAQWNLQRAGAAQGCRKDFNFEFTARFFGKDILGAQNPIAFGRWCFSDGFNEYFVSLENSSTVQATGS